MRKQLRDYQREAYRFIRKRGFGALFMEMRLGKTLVCVRLIEKQKWFPALVVAPPSALGSWEDELPSEECVNISSGTAAVRAKAAGSVPWTLVNWQAHRSAPVGDALASGAWKSIVLDESAQYLRNPKSKVTKFFTKKFFHVPHKFILTGTPAPESLLDYYSQMQFLLDGTFCGFSNYWTFRKFLFSPDPSGYDWYPKPDTPQRVRDTVGRFAYRLKRKDVNIDQPKVHETRRVVLPQKLGKVYRKLERDFVLEIGENVESHMYRLPQYVRLRQLSSGIDPLVVDGSRIVWDGKIKELESLLSGELKGERVVVWFAFTATLEAVLRRLQENGHRVAAIHGAVSPVARESIRRSFTFGEIDVLLCQVETASTGMNLAASDTAIYFEHPPGYLSYRQSEDRILKVAENHPLLIMHLVTKDTVDEDMQVALKMKGYKADSDFQLSGLRSMMLRHGVSEE